MTGRVPANAVLLGRCDAALRDGGTIVVKHHASSPDRKARMEWLTMRERRPDRIGATTRVWGYTGRTESAGRDYRDSVQALRGDADVVSVTCR